MEVVVKNTNIFSGFVKIPTSKSFTQRALALALLVKGKTELHEVGNSDDEISALSVIQKCGAKINCKNNTVSIKSNGINLDKKTDVNIGESGLSTRMFIPILANSSHQVTVNGKGSIMKREMSFFDRVLPLLNIQYFSTKQKLPVSMQGPLSPKDIVLDGSQSSQYITGIVYGYIASKKLKNETISITDLKSRPYLQLSLDILKIFGVSLELKNNHIQFNGPYALKPTSLTLEGDWSSASFLLVAAAVFGEIKVSNLNKNSIQADKRILDALMIFGANIRWDKNELIVKKNKCNSFTFDATHCPDLFPPLAVLATFGSKPGVIKGISRLFNKESNRAIALQQEFKKMGVKILLDKKNDEMIVYPCSKIKGGVVESHGDHRIAMALTLLGLASLEDLIIKDAGAITKSFPEFYEKINLLTDKSVLFSKK